MKIDECLLRQQRIKVVPDLGKPTIKIGAGAKSLDPGFVIGVLTTINDEWGRSINKQHFLIQCVLYQHVKGNYRHAHLIS